MYAANGLGVLLAEKGHFYQARETFAAVRDANGDNLDFLVNLAHSNLELGMFPSAVKLVRSMTAASPRVGGRGAPHTHTKVPLARASGGACA